MTPRASVIMPCRNAARTLPFAVESVLASSFADLELLISDDGSTDDTADVIARFVRRDSRVRAVFPRRAGVSAARNAALDAARGEWVFFVDADDLWAADCCEKVLARLDETGADYCLFGCAVRRPDGRDWETVPLKSAQEIVGNDAIRERYLPRIFGYSFDDVRAWYRGRPFFAEREMAQVWRAAFRRDAIERHGVRFDESLALNEDAMFNAEYLLHAERMTFLDEPLYYYVQGAGGQMRTVSATAAYFDNKARLLAKREALDALSGGRLGPLYAGSCVLGVLEMLDAARRVKAPWPVCRRALKRYMEDPVVQAALSRFPLSARHPGMLFGVVALRLGLAMPMMRAFHILA
ncbi:MAG: glycosyltransferase [Kiritimatiellae bacterium]|nr:glycosyltransferase [Kiritimatiellia bacterium]